jgi:hypothetical protein
MHSQYKTTRKERLHSGSLLYVKERREKRPDGFLVVMKVRRKLGWYISMSFPIA